MARRCVAAFYATLAEGARQAGHAGRAGRQPDGEPYRGKIMGAGDLLLRDWFVGPGVYQEEHDLQLITALLTPGGAPVTSPTASV